MQNKKTKIIASLVLGLGTVAGLFLAFYQQFAGVFLSADLLQESMKGYSEVNTTSVSTGLTLGESAPTPSLLSSQDYSLGGGQKLPSSFGGAAAQNAVSPKFDSMQTSSAASASPSAGSAATKKAAANSGAAADTKQPNADSQKPAESQPAGGAAATEDLKFRVKLQLPFTPQQDGKQQFIEGRDGEEILQKYANEIYKYLAGTAGILAVLMIVFSGIQISVSGVEDGVSEAKERIMGALAGLALLFLSGLVLHTINPTFFV